jgi:hypothetical protein
VCQRISFRRADAEKITGFAAANDLPGHPASMPRPDWSRPPSTSQGGRTAPSRPPARLAVHCGGPRQGRSPSHARDPHARTHAVRPARPGHAPVRPREAESGRPRTSRTPLRARPAHICARFARDSANAKIDPLHPPNENMDPHPPFPVRLASASPGACGNPGRTLTPLTPRKGTLTPTPTPQNGPFWGQKGGQGGQGGKRRT